MESSKLIAVTYMLFLDGVGLIVVTNRLRCVLVAIQGIFEIGTGVTGLIILLRGDITIWWIGLALATLICHILLYHILYKWRVDFSNLRVKRLYFSLETWSYFVLSLFTRYTPLERALNLPEWGTAAWNLLFGTTAVLLWGLGGMGLMSLLSSCFLLTVMRLLLLVGLLSVAQRVILAI